MAPISSSELPEVLQTRNHIGVLPDLVCDYCGFNQKRRILYK